MVKIEMAFQKSSLPEYPNTIKIICLLTDIRQDLYS